ncbi:MAG: hypothetical protein ACR2HS_02375 [Gammaproteobacteria bacterium]
MLFTKDQKSNKNTKEIDKLHSLQKREAIITTKIQKLQKSIKLITKRRELRKKILVGTYFLAQAKKENKILELNKTILATLKKEEDRELFNEQ